MDSSPSVDFTSPWQSIDIHGHSSTISMRNLIHRAQTHDKSLSRKAMLVSRRRQAMAEIGVNLCLTVHGF